ncbi:TPA: hypothetical protein RY369_004405, partial [Escherichia albertii]|nr:hypothetical protein [Escherichia albertii]
SDFRLYREITDGKSITYMIAGLNKEYGDVVESVLVRVNVKTRICKSENAGAFALRKAQQIKA